MPKQKKYPAKSKVNNRAQTDNLSINRGGHMNDESTAPPVSQPDIERGLAEDARYNTNNVN